MIKNRPLSLKEKQELHPNYQEIVHHYEKVTKRPFMKDELVTLKLLVELAYPAQIMQTISRFYKLYPDRFKNLSYIHTPVKNMFKDKRGAK